MSSEPTPSPTGSDRAATPSPDASSSPTPSRSSSTPPTRPRAPEETRNTEHGGRTAIREALEEAFAKKEEREGDAEGAATAPERPVDGHEPDRGAKSAQREEAAPGASEGPPRSMAEVAERLGVTETELYDSLAINLGDGETVTLAGAKDRLRDIGEREQGIARREAEADNRQAQYASDVQAMGILEAMRAIPQHLREQANQHLVAAGNRGAENFRVLHPDYRDEGKWRDLLDRGQGLLGEHKLSASPAGIVGKPEDMLAFVASALKWKRNSDAYTKPVPKDPPKPPKRGRDPSSNGAAEPLNLQGTARQRFAQVARHRRK